MKDGANDKVTLVVNTGSTSNKLSLFALKDEVLQEEPVWTASLNFSEGTTTTTVRHGQDVTTESSQSDLFSCTRSILEPLRDRFSIVAVGHRIVHGGAEHSAPIVLSKDVVAGIDALSALAPLHQPAGLKGIALTTELLPNVTQVAVFDTAYFRRLPDSAKFYAVPHDWHEKFGIQRFGFHGINHEYSAAKAASYLDAGSARRIITCHLGGGASIAANLDGRPLATTMGFTPLDGLIMSTRSGSLDPGIILYLLQTKSLTESQISHDLNYESGLKGLSGLSADMKILQTEAASGHEGAKLAIEIYTKNIAQYISSMLPILGGADAIVFTAGIGENSPFIRQAITRQLVFLGLSIDSDLNAACRADADISAKGSSIKTIVVHAREDLAIAKATSEKVMVLSG